MKTNDDGKDRNEMKIMKRDREEEIINGMKTMFKKNREVVGKADGIQRGERK